MRIAVTLTLFALVLGAACLALPGPVPGDVAVTLALQWLSGPTPQWAQWLTNTAKPPLVIATIIVGGGLAWLVSGWRGALAVPLAFGLGWVIDKALRGIIFDPRPAPALVEIASASSSSGLPSTFGLAYGSVFGVVLLTRTAGLNAMLLRTFAAVLVIAGTAARVVLGGHWASQMVVSILLGLAAAAAARTITDHLRRGDLANAR